ncbi:MAG: DUF1559 domain-containing protein, partial [Thermoguttaceae bacterium]|nr:DUF1559 domain-containing protein [Thermoguttaceae bacterium]
VKDGLTNTVLISESLQAGSMWQNAEYQVGFCWSQNGFAIPSSCDFTTVSGISFPMKINRCRDEYDGTEYATADPREQSTTSAWAFARMSSSHPGIVVAAMADGSARNLSEDIDLEILVRVMAPVDKKCAYASNPGFTTTTLLDLSKL